MVFGAFLKAWKAKQPNEEKSREREEKRGKKMKKDGVETEMGRPPSLPYKQVVCSNFFFFLSPNIFDVSGGRRYRGDMWACVCLWVCVCDGKRASHFSFFVCVATVCILKKGEESDKILVGRNLLFLFSSLSRMSVLLFFFGSWAWHYWSSSFLLASTCPCCCFPFPLFCLFLSLSVRARKPAYLLLCSTSRGRIYDVRDGHFVAHLTIEALQKKEKA